MLKTIKLISIFLLSLFLVVWFILFAGIKIDSFSFGNFSISQLYLKLDKKLILEAEKIVLEVKKSNVKNSIDGLLKDISKFETILKIFKKIDVKKFKIKDNEFVIKLNEKSLYLDNKYFNILADLNISSSQIFLNLYSLYLKDLDATLIGRTKIDLSKRTLYFLGDYTYSSLFGKFNLELNEKFADFNINTTKSIKSIKFLKNFFTIDKIAEEWMYDNVTGDINLNYLYGKIDVKNRRIIKDSIKGEAVINNAKIRFHKDLQTVNTKKLLIKYKKDKLSFDLEKPSYKKSKIYGSRVYIKDLTNLEKGTVFVDLKTESKLNNDVLEILNAYEIKLSLKQKSGKLNSSLLLKIPYLSSKEMEIDALFKINNASLMLNDFDFFVKKADVVLKDNDVLIKNSHLLYKNIIDTNLDLKIDLKKSLAKGNVKINSLDIKSDEKSIINLKNHNTDLAVTFKDTTTIDIKALKTKLEIKKDYIDINIADLKTISPYSALLKNSGIEYGDLNIRVFDKNSIKFLLNVQKLNLPFEKNGKKITTLSATGTIQNDLIKIKTNSDDLEIILLKGKNPILKLKDTDLVLYTDSKKSEEKKEFPNIDLELKNVKIKVDKVHQYDIAWANINIKDSKVSFEAEALNLELPILKDDKKVTSLVAYGTYEKETFHLKTKDNNLILKYEIPDEKISMTLKGYDIVYDSKLETNKESKISFYINGVDSNIIINKKYIAKATSFNFIFEKNNKTDIDLKYKDTSFFYHKDIQGNMEIKASNMNDEFLNSILSKNLIKGGNVDFSGRGKHGRLSAKANLKDTKIVDLAILNNLIMLINTSPVLINPFLVIPPVIGMAVNDGFTLNGYKVIEGTIDFVYDFNMKFLNMHKIKTKGNGIDFDGYVTINFNNLKVDSKLKLIFFKSYSSIVGAIPVVNYILLGDEKTVDTDIFINGTLDEPQYRTKFVEDGGFAPINIIKRIITSPIKLIKSVENLGKDNEKEKKKKNE